MKNKSQVDADAGLVWSGVGDGENFNGVWEPAGAYSLRCSGKLNVTNGLRELDTQEGKGCHSRAPPFGPGRPKPAHECMRRRDTTVLKKNIR